jgi:hypothetical protein
MGMKIFVFFDRNSKTVELRFFDKSEGTNR